MSAGDIHSSSPLLPSYQDSSSIPLISSLSPVRRSLSPEKRPLSASPSPVDHQQTANKRQKADIARGTRLLSHALKKSLGSFLTSDERYTVAVEAARNFDEQRQLPCEDTVVTLREPLHSSQSEQYEHSNLSNWENDRLLYGDLVSQIRLGLRCFLDAFYFECGYVSSWNQNQTQTSTSGYPSRAEAVYNAIEMLSDHGVTTAHLPYLVGKYSHYRDTHGYIHDLPLPVIGAAMSKWSRQCIPERQSAYLAVWKFLTGYESWEEGGNDTRWIGSSGVTDDDGPFDETPLQYDPEVLFRKGNN